MEALARLDWLTLRSQVEPREGARWRGGPSAGRFVAVDTPGLEVRVGTDRGGAFAVPLTGEFFRQGHDWRAFVRDVWGWPPPAMGASRVDVAVQYATGGRLGNLEGAALRLIELLTTANPQRYGWTREPRDSRLSGGGVTWYVYPAGREPGRTATEARSGPYLWRIYQKPAEQSAAGVSWAPMRVEYERKEFGTIYSAEEAVLQAAMEFEHAMSVRLTDEHAAGGVVDGEALDGRQRPEKLLRQAYGLARLAELRAHHGALKEDVRSQFRKLWRMLIGTEFDGLTYEERRAADKAQRERDAHEREREARRRGE